MKEYINTYHFALIAGTLLFSTMLVFVIYFVFYHHRTRQKFEWERQQFKQALLLAEVEIREHTLKHISRELHDNLGQMASLVKINLNMLAADVNEKERERVNESLELIRRLIQDIKILSTSLNNESLGQLKFTEAIEKDIERINKFQSVKIIYENRIDFPKLKFGIEVFLYRMFQEIMSNTLKHAQATQARLEISIEAGKLNISFDDNGKGFDKKEAMDKGSGLTNLRERCRIIGAHLDIHSIPGKGTGIKIILPITT